MNESKNNIVLGQFHNDYTMSDLIIISIGMIIIIAFAVSLALLFPMLEMYIGASVMVFIALLLLIISINTYKKNINTPNEIIVYDSNDNSFIINYYAKKISLSVDDIIDVSYKNKFLTFLDLIAFFERQEYGNIIYTLKNGNRIKSLMINDVVMVNESIKDIIANNEV